jgi:hypothetical protein
MTSVVPQNAPQESLALAPATFRAHAASLSAFSGPRKQLFFEIPIKALSNAIALPFRIVPLGAGIHLN